MDKLYTNLKKDIIKSQHVQRCWDLSKTIPDEDIELLVHAATNCPSKQNFRFYKVHVITNRKIIEKAHSMTEGLRNVHGEMSTNSQTLANLLLIFEDVERSEKYVRKWKDRDESSKRCWSRDQDMAIGVAAGYVNVIASILGYGTGCCACFDGKEVSKELGLEKEVILMMGIGYSDETRNRRIHHETNLMMPTRLKESIEVVYYN